MRCSGAVCIVTQLNLQHIRKSILKLKLLIKEISFIVTWPLVDIILTRAGLSSYVHISEAE